jgi:GWxTD domain-containing protein
MRRLLIWLLVLSILSSFVVSSFSPVYAGFDNEKKTIKKLKRKYQKWLEEVTYIITKREKETFLTLESDEMRDKFIDYFWQMRDPTPGTVSNEFKEEYYKRLEYADKFLGRETYKKGWKTDRGKMHILLGPPRDIQRFDNTEHTYPLELWHYDSGGLPGLPPFFHLIFFKRHGVAEYVLYDPIRDGMEELLLPSLEADKGSEAMYRLLYETSPELARAALSLDDGEPPDYFSFRPAMSSTILLGKIASIPEELINPEYVDDFLKGIPSVRVEYSYRLISLYSSLNTFQNEQGDSFFHFALGIEPENVSLGKYKDKYYGGFEITGDLSDTKGKIIAKIEDRVEINLSDEEFSEVKSSPFVFEGKKVILPGRYKVKLYLRNNVSREYGFVEDTIDVPDPSSELVQLTPPVLAFKVIRNDRKYGEPRKPYELGDFVFFTSPTNVFPRNSKGYLFYQLFIPQGKVISPYSLAARYEVTDGKKVVFSEDEFLSGYYSGGKAVLNLAKEIPFSFPPGEYDLKLRITSGEEELADARPIKFTVSSYSKLPSPYIYARDFPPPFSSVYNYEKGKGYLALGKKEEAEREFRQALTKNPDFVAARKELVQLYLGGDKYRKVIDLLEPVIVKSPRDYETLMVLGLSYDKLGEYYDAIRYYERARMVTGEDASVNLLNRLGNVYIKAENLKKAKEILEISLKKKPNQPVISKKLEEIKTKLSGG